MPITHIQGVVDMRVGGSRHHRPCTILCTHIQSVNAHTRGTSLTSILMQKHTLITIHPMHHIPMGAMIAPILPTTLTQPNRILKEWEAIIARPSNRKHGRRRGRLYAV